MGGSSSAALPDELVVRINALWDELADFGAHQIDAALAHALRVLGDLVGAQRAFWLGAVRLGDGNDPIHGWRMRGGKRVDPTPDSERISKLARRSFDTATADAVTLAQVRLAGRFRASLLRELAPPDFSASREYEILYRSRNIHDAIFVTFPLNDDAESYYGWYRVGDQGGPFTPLDRDVLAHALRPIKWFHRRVMLQHGLLIAKAPLSPMERRLVSLLLTDRLEKEIAHDLALAPATAHNYITALFRKFGVSGRSGLTALWLGQSPG